MGDVGRSRTGAQIAALSTWIDTSKSYVGLDPEAHLWRRTMKVASEVGELQDALGGMLGENPRKGVTHTLDDAIGEALDVAVAALGSVEHMTGNEGRSMDLLAAKVERIIERAGLTENVSNQTPRPPT